MSDPGILRGCKNIAAYIGFSENETQQKAFDGEIPAFKIGNIWHMRKTAWDQFVDDLAERAYDKAFVQLGNNAKNGNNVEQ